MTATFFIKKLIASCLMPPGLFIVLCLAIAFFAKKRVKLMVLALAAIIYVASITPTAYLLLGPLERAYPLPSVEEVRQSDVYIVLGGGAKRNVPTIDGKGMPAGDALFRVVAAYRLYLLSPKPILISGGDYTGREPEAEVVKRYLMNLGVREDHLIAEVKSRDTYENARYSKEICEKRGFRKVLLITNAYHMKRSVLLFHKLFGPVTPFPASFAGGRMGRFDLLQFLPDASSIHGVATALREYMGILYYKITL